MGYLDTVKAEIASKQTLETTLARAKKEVTLSLQKYTQKQLNDLYKKLVKWFQYEDLVADKNEKEFPPYNRDITMKALAKLILSADPIGTEGGMLDFVVTHKLMKSEK